MQLQINLISAKINTDPLSLIGYGTFEFLTSWLLGSQFTLGTARSVGGESEPPLYNIWVLHFVKVNFEGWLSMTGQSPECCSVEVSNFQTLRENT